MSNKFSCDSVQWSGNELLLVSEHGDNKDPRWWLVVCVGDSPATAPSSAQPPARRSASAAPAPCSATSVHSQRRRRSSRSWTLLADDPHTLPWRHAAARRVNLRAKLFFISSRCTLSLVIFKCPTCLCFHPIISNFKKCPSPLNYSKFQRHPLLGAWELRCCLSRMDFVAVSLHVKHSCIGKYWYAKGSNDETKLSLFKH